MSKSISTITNAGYRLTIPRKTILNAVSDTPLTASEIHQKLKSAHTAQDLATVYRNLELLVKLHLVTKINFEDNIARYERTPPTHHHHLICEQCGSIEDISLQEEPILKQITQKSSFKVEHHALEFFGFCTNCQ